jgi:hypothetical protein
VTFPWRQAVRLLPAVLALSHDLLQRRRPAADDGMDARVRALESSRTALEQLASSTTELMHALTRAVTVLHRTLIAVVVLCGLALAAAVAALVMVWR